jgi:amino acid adenylation domain-containing protein
MSVTELLATLKGQGVELWFEGERLRFRAQKGSLSAEQRAQLSARRTEVVAHLRAEAGGRDMTCPLSFSQRSLWFLHQQEPKSTAYHVAMSVRVRSAVNTAALRQALQALVDRHAILRSSYGVVGESPSQRVAGAATANLDVHDVHDIDEPELRNRVEADYRRPFDLERGPVVRSSLYTRAAGDHVLLLTVHHIVADGWSLLLTFEELLKLYAESTGGPPAGLARPELQYTDYVEWQDQALAGPEGDRLWAYWRDKLAQLPAPLDLPTDHSRPAIQTFRGASWPLHLGSDLTARLRQVARQEGTTPFVVLLASFQAFLFRLTGSDDVIVGTPTFGRSKAEFVRVVGDFVNSVPLRGRMNAAMTFREFIAQLRQTVLEALDAQEFPLPLLVQRLAPERDPSRSPLFDTFFLLQRFDQFRELSDLLVGGEAEVAVDIGGLRLTGYPLHQQEGQFDLALQMIDCGGDLQGVFKYGSELFEEATIERLAGHYLQLLAGAVADPTQRLSQLPLLTAGEQAQIAVRNVTAAPYPRETGLLGLVRDRVARCPDAMAVRQGERGLTYRALEADAEQVAGFLRSLGVRPGALVGVCLDRTPEMVVVLLGVLKAGGAYVPLDPAYPAARLAFMVEDSGAQVVVTETVHTGLIPASVPHVVCLDRDRAEIDAAPAQAPWPWPDPENLAYVIYTSGSTGQPKGVEIPHGALVNLLTAMAREPGCTASDVLLAVTTLSFDIAALELFLPLITGGTVVLATREEAADPQALIALLHTTHATVMQATPATWRMLVAAGWSGTPGLTVLCGGEALSHDLASALRVRASAVWNVYGPTETTIWSAVWRVETDEGPIVIGRPIANTELYVCDQWRNPQPVGVIGELYIGGHGLARGYRNRPDLTAERFVPHPFSPVPGARLYRTGDLARWRPDGTVECLGRMDHQVKIRGFRIELGEIEGILTTHPGVKECVVTVREDAPGDQRLVGYVVATAGASFDADAARTTLRAKLPAYMIPNAFVVLAALPLTPNGKIDRQVLPAPEAPPPRVAEMSDALMTSAQRRVAGIWRDVLRVDRVGLHDNFYDLGGHSLLLVTLHAGLKREFSADLALVELFQRTTVAAQADRLSSAAPADGALRRAQARAARQIHG